MAGIVERRTEKVCKFSSASGWSDWDVAQTRRLLRQSRINVPYTLLAEKTEGALAFSCLRCIVLGIFLSPSPSCFLYEGLILTNKLFIKLKGACILIILVNVLHLILFISLAM